MTPIFDATLYGEQRSVLHRLTLMNWLLTAPLLLLAAIGYVALTGAAVGDRTQLANPHAIKFATATAAYLAISLVHINFWRRAAPVLYLGSLLLLVLVPLIGDLEGGARRWIDLGLLRLQPSEPMKVALVVAVAALYARLHAAAASRALTHLLAFAVIVPPALLILRQPDLGTAILTLAGGLAVMFLAGIPLVLVGACVGTAGALILAVFVSRGTSWQLFREYQYERIDVFFDPSLDPLGAGYHMTQSQVAFGSGGVWGAGFMQGSQSYLNFLPEKHTDFVFATIAEEFGLVGSLFVLGLYALTLAICAVMTLRLRDRFSQLLAGGLLCVFFLYFAANMGMVVGFLPVVGVPLPLVSHGGSSMFTVMVGFGLIQSAYASRRRVAT